MILTILAVLVAQTRPDSATDTYTACIAGNARAFARDRDIARPIDATVAQCEPFLAAAAAELGVMAGKAGREKLSADYRQTHGTDPDMTILLADLVRGAGRDFAERLIDGKGYDGSPKAGKP